jgi:putative peptidoglycan lipid II flippase
MMLVKILASGFYARQDIKTPVKIAVVSLLINVVFNFVLISSLKHAGLALASSIAALANTVFMLIILLRRKIFEVDKTWWIFLLRMCLANGVLFLWLYFFTSQQSQWFSWHWWQRGWHVLWLIGVACVLYMGVLKLSGFRTSMREMAEEV